MPKPWKLRRVPTPGKSMSGFMWELTYTPAPFGDKYPARTQYFFYWDYAVGCMVDLMRQRAEDYAFSIGVAVG